MDLSLTDTEARVLGALIEKDITTPDYYPLSLNALVNACNQKSNREPVMTLDEDTVRQALGRLHERNLAGPTSSADSRVPKYEHRMQEVFNFDRREIAVLCVLLLRGPQTPGELRGRTERMYRFEELADVQATLQRLIERDPPLARMLPRQPGTKEARYTHLLSGEVEAGVSTTHETGVSDWQALAPATAPASENFRGTPVLPEMGLNEAERLAILEAEVERVKNEIAELKDQLTAFKKQFE